MFTRQVSAPSLLFPLTGTNILVFILISALSPPLPEDFDLFTEVDFVLVEIRRCYMELGKFWREEIFRAIKVLETRHVASDDVERWRGFKASLEQTIQSWKVLSYVFALYREQTDSFRTTNMMVVSGTHPIIIRQAPLFVRFPTYFTFRYLTLYRVPTSGR
jgi:hypothetical protein